MGEHCTDNQYVGAQGPFVSHTTKLAGKIYFPTYCNYLIFNNIYLELNRCNSGNNFEKKLFPLLTLAHHHFFINFEEYSKN